MNLAGEGETEVSTDPITKKKCLILVSYLLKFVIPLISKSPIQSSKTKYLVTAPRLRWSSDPSSATMTSWAKCMWVLKKHSSVMAQSRGCWEVSECFWLFQSRWSWAKLFTLVLLTGVETNGKHIKWVTVLRRASEKGEIRTGVEVYLNRGPLLLTYTWEN